MRRERVVVRLQRLRLQVLGLKPRLKPSPVDQLFVWGLTGVVRAAVSLSLISGMGDLLLWAEKGWQHGGLPA